MIGHMKGAGYSMIGWINDWVYDWVDEDSNLQRGMQ